MTLNEAIEIIKNAIGSRVHDKRTLEHKAMSRIEREYRGSLEFEETQKRINSIIDDVIGGANE